MSLAIFVVGVLVFLITVYGTVVVGGLLLTDRQLDEQPELVPDQNRPHDDAAEPNRPRDRGGPLGLLSGHGHAARRVSPICS